MARSQTPAKGYSKGMKSARGAGASRETDSAAVLALLPVPLGPGAMGAPMPSMGDSRRLEERRGTTTRLRDTIKMMNARRV
jgi:hypothetical protein